jgi:hypothetical protein
MGEYHIKGGTQAAVGDNAIGTINFGGKHDPIDRELLLRELAQVRQAAKTQASCLADDRAVVALGEAIEAAKQPDPDVDSIENRLASTGKWVAKIAQEIGANVVAELISKGISG